MSRSSAARPVRQAVAPPAGAPAAEPASGSSPVAVYRLYLGLIVMTLLNIPSRFPVVGMLRPTLVLVALISGLILLARSGPERKDLSGTTRLLNALIVYIVISVPFVAWPGSVVKHGLDVFIKAVVFFYFTVQLVDTLPRLRSFVVVVFGCQVLRVLEPLFLHLTTGYWGSYADMGDGYVLERLAGAPDDIVNPNGLAFVILTALPFLYYLIGGSRRTIIRLASIGLIAALLYALVLTGSRSGMVGLLVVVAAIIYRSRRRTAILVVAAIASVLLVSVMTPDMRDRYLSLTEGDTRNAATTKGRIEHMLDEVQVASRRPFVGHGLGTSQEALANEAGRYQPSHNLYLEVMIELGMVGLVIYLMFLASVFRNLQEVRASITALGRQREPENGDWQFYERCTGATLVLVLMCLVFSIASYGLSEFYWYLLAGLSVALRNLLAAETRSPAAVAQTPAS
ncbi:MAG: O-antigen ligase family protein [Gammaproteobacteria bacterium]|nr:O-antigen ligase family protein [Gammaproteobacteria bacterium]